MKSIFVQYSLLLIYMWIPTVFLKKSQKKKYVMFPIPLISGRKSNMVSKLIVFSLLHLLEAYESTTEGKSYLLDWVIIF